MSKRFSVFTNPLFLTISLFILQLGLFIALTLHAFSLAPADRTYYMLRGQGGYTAFIRESKNGAWNLYIPYTTRSIPSIYFHLFYVLEGKIANIFSLDPVSLYMATRVASGLCLFVATYWLIGTILPARFRSLAVLFALGLEPGPLISTIKNIGSFMIAPPAIFSYFPQEVALRHFGLPHHVLAEAVGLLMIGNIFLFVKKTSMGRLIGIMALTVTGALLMPAYSSIFAITVCPVWFFWLYIRGKSKKILPAFIVIALSLAAVGIFTKLQMDAGGYPYKNFNLDEKRWVTDPFLLANYLSSLLLYIPAVVFLWVALLRIRRAMTADVQLVTVLTTTWVVGPLFYIPLTHMVAFPFANFRLVDGYAYVPMGILAAISIDEIARLFNKRMAAVAAAIIIATSLFCTLNFTRQTFNEQKIIWTNVYPLNQEWDAIKFLSTVPPQSGVMVMKYFGEIIPSYATVRVYLGETPGFLDWDERYSAAVRFYSGQLADTEAKHFLTSEHINYVYWGQNEKEFLKTTSLYPNILTPVFQNPAVIIFQVAK